MNNKQYFQFSLHEIYHWLTIGQSEIFDTISHGAISPKYLMIHVTMHLDKFNPFPDESVELDLMQWVDHIYVLSM